MRRPAARAVVLALAVALTVAGCGGGDGPESESGSEPAAGPDCGPALPAKPNGNGWTCTFADDFEGDELDLTRWSPLETKLNGQRTGIECLSSSPDNIEVDGGQLRLTVRRLDEPFTCDSPLGDFSTQYTAAMVTTARKFAQAYGRFEVRARFPDSRTPGLQSALWLYPNQDLYGPWPRSGEIDLAEWFSNVPDVVIPNLHYLRGGRSAHTTNRRCAVTDPASFHTYVLAWSPQLITMAYDGVVCLRADPARLSDLGGVAPFDRPFAVLLAQGLGVRLNVVRPGTELPASLEVDHVRVWR